MVDDVPPEDKEILDRIVASGGRVDPRDLIKALQVDHKIENVIEGLQRAIERGKITLDADGMVVTTASMLQAA